MHYWKASFVLLNLDELKNYIESMPAEAKRYPIPIEVGLWGKSPAKTWALAKSIIIYHLGLFIRPKTSMNIPKKHINDVSCLHGKGALRQLRGAHNEYLENVPTRMELDDIREAMKISSKDKLLEETWVMKILISFHERGGVHEVRSRRT